MIGKRSFSSFCKKTRETFKGYLADRCGVACGKSFIYVYISV